MDLSRLMRRHGIKLFLPSSCSVEDCSLAVGQACWPQQGEIGRSDERSCGDFSRQHPEHDGGECVTVNDMFP